MYSSPNEATFRKSSYSANESACVEVADLPDGAAVRDSQHPGRGHLTVPGREWAALLSAVQR